MAGGAQGVLLATCFDAEQLEAIRRLEKQYVEVGVTPTGEVAAEVVERKDAGALYTGGGLLGVVWESLFEGVGLVPIKWSIL